MAFLIRPLRSESEYRDRRARRPARRTAQRACAPRRARSLVRLRSKRHPALSGSSVSARLRWSPLALSPRALCAGPDNTGQLFLGKHFAKNRHLNTPLQRKDPVSIATSRPGRRSLNSKPSPAPARLPVQGVCPVTTTRPLAWWEANLLERISASRGRMSLFDLR